MIVVYYKGKSYYADNGSKSSSVGVEGSLLFQACFCCSNLGHNKLIFCYTQTRMFKILVDEAILFIFFPHGVNLFIEFKLKTIIS